jgi:hypothetical protein
MQAINCFIKIILLDLAREVWWPLWQLRLFGRKLSVEHICMKMRKLVVENAKTHSHNHSIENMTVLPEITTVNSSHFQLVLSHF